MRLKDNMGLIQAVTTLSGGVPGSVNALVAVVKDCINIDPTNSTGAVGYLSLLDHFGIYDQNIFKLFYICKEDTVKFMALIRSLQIGLVDEQELKNLIQTYQSSNLDFKNLISEVRKRIGNFASGYKI